MNPNQIPNLDLIIAIVLFFIMGCYAVDDYRKARKDKPVIQHKRCNRITLITKRGSYGE